MRMIKQFSIAVLLTAFMATLTACSPEVGSDAWCEDMKQTPTGDWSTNQATDFAKHCLLK